MNQNRDNFGPILKKYLESTSGRQKLAESLVAPLRRNIDYQGIARRAFSVDPLPIAKCPECGVEIYNEHPDNGCSYGDIYNIMET